MEKKRRRQSQASDFVVLPSGDPCIRCQRPAKPGQMCESCAAEWVAAFPPRQAPKGRAA